MRLYFIGRTDDMKKGLMIFISFLLIFSLFACAEKETEDISAVERPPAFSVLQKQLKHTKHSEKGESATFSKNEFCELLGEDIGYVTVTMLPEAEKGTLVFNGNAVLLNQSIPSDSLEFLKFVPEGNTELAVFGFSTDAKAFGEYEMVCEIVFGDEKNLAPTVGDTTLKTVSGIACGGSLDIDEPNGDDFTVNVITYPTKGFISVSEEGNVVYTPEEGFFGNDRMVFTVTDRFGCVSEQATLFISVEENKSGIYFADMQDDENHLFAHKMCDSEVMIYRYEDGKYYFEPTKTVSKMEFLVMMMDVAELDAGITAVADSVADDDNGLSSGLKGYISAAADYGILKLDNGKFSPNEGVSFSDAAYMISKALKLPFSNTENSLDAILKAGIADFENISDGTATLTKADVAKLLCGIENYIIENNIKIS